MPDLKKSFENCGYEDVITYINSGNVIFSSVYNDKEEIKRICESVIADQFRLNIAVTIISAEELSDSLHNAPTWWESPKRNMNRWVITDR